MPARILRKTEWTPSDGNPDPDVSFMPMLVRRRLSTVERAALHVAWKIFDPGEAEEVSGPIPEPGTVPVVFASRWGEIGTTLKLIRQLHSEGEMSPAGFSSSVHNAAPGAWSLFTGNKAPYTSIAARERTYEAGMIEAEAQLAASGGPVLFIYAEEATPAYYRSAFPDPECARAEALLLVPGGE